MNVAHLNGRCGVDPELRHTTEGTAVCNLRIATKHFRGSGQERQEQTDWHTIVLFGKQAEVAVQYLKKGDMCNVTGRIQTRQWQDNTGNDRYTTEIVANEFNLLTPKGESGTSRQQYNTQDTSFNTQQFEVEDEFAPR